MSVASQSSSARHCAKPLTVQSVEICALKTSHYSLQRSRKAMTLHHQTPEFRRCVKSRGGRPISPYGLCGRKATLNLNLNSEHHFATPSSRKKDVVNQSQEFASTVSNSHLAGIGHSSSTELLSLHYDKHTHTHITTTHTHTHTHARTHPPAPPPTHTHSQNINNNNKTLTDSSRMPLMRISGRTFLGTIIPGSYFLTPADFSRTKFSVHNFLVHLNPIQSSHLLFFHSLASSESRELFQ